MCTAVDETKRGFGLLVPSTQATAERWLAWHASPAGGDLGAKPLWPGRRPLPETLTVAGLLGQRLARRYLSTLKLDRHAGQQARSLLREAASLKPTRVDFLADYGLLLGVDGEWEEAERWLSSAADAGNRRARAVLRLNKAFTNRGRAQPLLRCTSRRLRRANCCDHHRSCPSFGARTKSTGLTASGSHQSSSSAAGAIAEPHVTAALRSDGCQWPVSVLAGGQEKSSLLWGCFRVWWVGGVLLVGRASRMR